MVRPQLHIEIGWLEQLHDICLHAISIFYFLYLMLVSKTLHKFLTFYAESEN